MALVLLLAGAAGWAEEPPSKTAFVLYGIEPYYGVSYHSLAGDERDRFDMRMYQTAAVPKDAKPIVEIEQAVNEFEPGVLAIANVSDPPVALEFKILPRPPRKNWTQITSPQPYVYFPETRPNEPYSENMDGSLRCLPLKNLRLASVAFMWVPGYGFDMPDALPPLGSTLITVPPGQTRFVWITVDSHGLAAGEYALDLEARLANYVGLENQEEGKQWVGVAAVARVNVTVWPFVLPDPWAGSPPWICTFDMNAALSSDKFCQNFREHGVNSWMVELALPPAMNPDGTLSKDPVEFRVMGGWRCSLPDAPLEEYIQRGKPSKGVFLISTHSFRPGYKNPWRRTDGQVEPVMSPTWQKAYASYLRQFVAFMKKQGLRYDDWWWYPYDENMSELVLQVATLTKQIDPNVKFFINAMTGDKAYLARWEGYCDIWCVHHQWPRKGNWGKGRSAYGWPLGPQESSAEGFKVFAETVKAPMICYTCGSDVRRFHPFFFWRYLGWEAQAHHFQGFIYYTPTAHGGDGWGRGHWYGKFLDAVYRDHTGDPVNTVRWEGFRDGVDDYFYIHLIRQGAARLPADSPTRKAAEELIANPLGMISQLPRNIDDLRAFRQNRRKLARMIIALAAAVEEGGRKGKP